MTSHLGPSGCWRVIGTRTPSADLFGGVTDYSEWEDVAEIEAIWNERNRPLLGHLATVPREHRAYGQGSSYLMAPFAYWTPGRFGDGSFGVLYAGLEEQTAITEVAWHRARFMRESRLPRQTTDHQLLGMTFEGTVEDLRGSTLPGLYAPDSWLKGQTQGAQARMEGADAVAYASVRRLGGGCLAGLRPNAFRHCRFLRNIQFFWDGDNLHAEGVPAC